MKKRSNPISMFVMIAVIGLVVSFFNSDFNIGSYFEGLETPNLEVVLEYLSLGLAFLVLGGLTLYFILRGDLPGKKPIGFEGWVENVKDDPEDEN